MAHAAQVKVTMSSINQDNNKDAPKRESWWQVLRSLITTIIVILAIRTLIIAPFTIPSGSMIPTLLVGDYVAVTKFDYGWSRYAIPFAPPLFDGRIAGKSPHRGDVAVFRYTHDTSIDYIKRIIGLPGDRIAMREGRLYVNDQLIDRTPLRPYEIRDENRRLLRGILYQEVLPGSDGRKPVTHDILQWSQAGFANNSEEYVVPQGYFFAMGDDRDDSADSRFQDEDGLGYVPMENLVGKARFIFYSFDARHPVWEIWHWPAEIRWSRLFSLVK